ncbi:TPA: hypothetical protein ACH3X1_012419 [Trebouxia sp. C0004]
MKMLPIEIPLLNTACPNNPLKRVQKKGGFTWGGTTGYHCIPSDYHGRMDQADTSMVISKEVHGKCVVVSSDLCTTHGNVEETSARDSATTLGFVWLATTK